MLIQTLNRRFEVIKAHSSGNDADILVCRDLWEDKDQEYLLIAIKNPDQIYRSAPFFAQLSQNGAFTDFVECFSRDGQFYIVFVHHAKPLFKEKFNEEVYFLNERLEIGKNLLSRMVLQNMPPCLQYEALQDRNLLLDESLQVYFNYALEEIPAHGFFTLARVQKELGRIFRLLLRQELATRVAEETEAFVSDLEECRFADYLGIYEVYDRLYVLLKGLQETGDIYPQSLPFRLWERLKKMAGYLRPVLAGVIIITALGFLIYTVTNPSVRASGGPVNIETIGTVKAE